MKHLQASGAKQGQWVTCTAKVKCRNGGVHVEDTVLTQVQESFKAQGKNVPLSEITFEDVKKFEDSVKEESRSERFDEQVAKIILALDANYPEIKAKSDLKPSRFGKRKYSVPRPDFIRIEEKLRQGETIFRGTQIFQVGIVLAPGMREQLTELGLTYTEEKGSWGERLFCVRYDDARTARAYCTVARNVHWMESEEIAEEFENDRQKIVSRNRLRKATFRKPIEVPLADYSKEEIAEGLFEGSLVHRKIEDRVYILKNPIIK